jgi:hypothetical protein
VSNNTYPSKQLADSLAPNSTLFPAFPLTIGRIWGWLKLTILSSILCLSLSNNHCCWRATSVRTSLVLYCFLFRPSRLAPESIKCSTLGCSRPVKSQPQHPAAPSQLDTSQLTLPWKQHSWWENGITWKSFLNNIRLLIQPYIFYCLISPWLEVFPIRSWRRKFCELIQLMDNFPTLILPFYVPSLLTA